jgi:hypothetical protein
MMRDLESDIYLQNNGKKNGCVRVTKTLGIIAPD